MKDGANNGQADEVLLIEDDPTVSEVVARYLEHEGLKVQRADNGTLGLARALEKPPDIVVLDIMLPGIDGLEVCRRLQDSVAVPIIMLTALGEESDRVIGLDLGADDYVTKPFSPRELVARVKAVLRRTRGRPDHLPERSEPLVTGNLRIDFDARRVFVDDAEPRLTSREFELLVFLVLHSGRAFTREQIMERVWGDSWGDKSTVTVHVRRLREKIEADPARPSRIKTVWGVGYRFDT